MSSEGFWTSPWRDSAFEWRSSASAFFCGLTRGAFCQVPYRWDLYPAKKTTTTVCSEQINANRQPSEPLAAPAPACTEVDRFEVVGPPIATSEGAATDTSTPSLYPSVVR